jgi:magnesium transporter
MQGNLVISDNAHADTASAAGTAGASDSGATFRTIGDPNVAAIESALQAGQRFWLDIPDVDSDVVALLQSTFGFHPLAVEDAEHFGQRPKVDSYDGFALLVAYGPGHDGTPVEVHCFLAENYLVTVRHGPVPGVAAAQVRLRQDRTLPPPAMLLYRVLDGLVDGFFPQLDGFDDAIDALQDDILRKPSDEQLGTLFDLKRRLIQIRRLTSDQRDAMADLLTGTRSIPGFDAETERYFRDVYDHLARLSQTADGYRDLLSSALDTHLSTTSNRLNVVMKQLAIIATIFLPMSFLTGFFGQNFGWMTDRLVSPAVFWIAGVALQAVVAGALLWMFRRKGWLGEKAGQ